MPKSDSQTRKTPSRVALKRRQAKEEILLAALEILSIEGVEGLTLASVADKLGFTKPALYHYFRSKEDLLRNLILLQIQAETAGMLAAVQHSARENVLGNIIRAFHKHYCSRLNLFRLVYCQLPLMGAQSLGLDQNTIQQNINPQTHRLFDAVVAILSVDGRVTPEMRRLAFSAWLSAVGLVEMIAIADSANDTLRHSDETLLNTLETVFNAAAERIAKVG